MAELKTKPNRKSVRKFLEAIDNQTRRQDCLMLLPLFEKTTGEKAVMWGDKIVGFGSYHYQYASGREGDWLLTGFSPGKQQLTIYVMLGFSNYQALMDELGQYKTGKSCLYITRLDKINSEVLEQLLRQSVADMRKRYFCA